MTAPACPNSKHESITFGGIFDVDNKRNQITQLESKSAQNGFWDDAAAAQKLLKNVKDLKRIVEPWEKADAEIGDLSEFLALASEENDKATLLDISVQADALEKQIAQMEFLRKLSGEDDGADAVVTIHSGAGGTESCDWTEMLYRMYVRYMERSGYACNVLEYSPGDEAGVKSVTVEVKGDYAYGHFKAETGVHRLVRISPFDSNARRHTSFSSVYAYPIMDEVEEYKLEDKDIRVDTYRASGAGGQHINKTDSAVRMTHIPTGIVVACQNERSQIQNRDTAMKLLKARVRQHYREIEERERESKLSEKKKIEWGSQIRSYVLHPYNMVKDHRTEAETSNTQAVLDGDIDMFIEAYLLMN